MLGRNESCPCGSGKKYKRCCLNKDVVTERASRKIVLSQKQYSQLYAKLYEYSRQPRFEEEYKKAQEMFYILDDENMNTNKDYCINPLDIVCLSFDEPDLVYSLQFDFIVELIEMIIKDNLTAYQKSILDKILTDDDIQTLLMQLSSIKEIYLYKTKISIFNYPTKESYHRKL